MNEIMVKAQEEAASNLMLHAGAFPAQRAEVMTIPAPPPEGRWHPIRHSTFVGEVESMLSDYGIEPRGEGAFALGGQEGARMFGVLPVRIASIGDLADLEFVLGLRNSTDKSYSASLVVGTRVFVCDNLAFSGSVGMRRKHTVNIMRDLPLLIADMLSQWGPMAHRQQYQIERMKEIETRPTEINTLLVESIRHDVLSTRRIKPILAYMDDPPEGHEPHTLWGVFNAFTGSLRAVRSETLLRDSMMIQAIFNRLVDRGPDPDFIDWEEVESAARVN